MNYLKNFMKKIPKKLVTHNGNFHSDDIFAAATLSIYLERQGEIFEIVRTRDEEIIASGDYVFDIGYVYDPDLNRFDHHQPGGAGKHESKNGEPGIEYSSFGLVWKKFGAELCGGEKAAGVMETKLVAPIDAFDNGFDLVQNKYETTPYYIQHLFFSMRPTWREEEARAKAEGIEHDSSKLKDEMFLKCVEIAKVALDREIILSNDMVLAENHVISDYEKSQDKRIIVLDDKYPFGALHDFPEPLYVIYPRNITSDWGIEAVSVNPKTFSNRKNFPEAWGGLRNEELEKVTGVEGSIFCHRGLFLAVAKTKEGAMKLAQIAVES
jgi:uncharacterized UPF0160 family protein